MLGAFLYKYLADGLGIINFSDQLLISAYCLAF